MFTADKSPIEVRAPHKRDDINKDSYLSKIKGCFKRASKNARGSRGTNFFIGKLQKERELKSWSKNLSSRPSTT